jgi:hypothetical protein
MKKLNSLNLGKNLGREEMKTINGGYPSGPGTCRGYWQDCLCGSSSGPVICRTCVTSPNAGQC